MSSIVLRTPLERKGLLPLHEQLRSALEMAIIAGEIPDGAALPSVRQLAETLDVSCSTVVRVYRDLRDEQLIRSSPKRGYFVTAGVTLDADRPAAAGVKQLVEEAINGALAAGLDLPSFLQLVVEQVKQRQRTVQRIAVVGLRDAALPERVEAVAEALADLPVEVLGLPFEELEQQSESERLARLGDVAWFVVSVGETGRAAELLGQRARRIVPMTRALRPDVRDFIGGQPDDKRFGIVAGSDALIGRILAMLRRLHPLRVPPATASVDDPERVERVLATADVVIIGSLAQPRMRGRVPKGKPSVELMYVPDERTLRRLRGLVAAGVRDQTGNAKPRTACRSRGTAEQGQARASSSRSSW